MNAIPHMPVSWGELLDKITILEIKRVRMCGEAARVNVVRELDLLQGIAAEVSQRDDIVQLINDLRQVNEALWDIEDAIREEDAAGRFGDGFVALARSVYVRNDERAAVKRAINVTLRSALIEEKSYKGLATA